MPVTIEPKNCSRCRKCARMDEAEYCSRCLAEVVEKRVNKKLSAMNCGSGKQGSCRILVACGSRESLSCAVAAYLAKKLCKAADVQVVKLRSLSSKTQQPHTKLIMPECADEAATSFLGKVIGGSFSGSRNPTAPNTADVVNIFESVTEKELELYATIKRIKYAKGKGSEYSGLKQKIQKLQAKYPGTIEALAQASRQMEEIRA